MQTLNLLPKNWLISADDNACYHLLAKKTPPLYPASTHRAHVITG